MIGLRNIQEKANKTKMYYMNKNYCLMPYLYLYMWNYPVTTIEATSKHGLYIYGDRGSDFHDRPIHLFKLQVFLFTIYIYSTSSQGSDSKHTYTHSNTYIHLLHFLIFPIPLFCPLSMSFDPNNLWYIYFVTSERF